MKMKNIAVAVFLVLIVSLVAVVVIPTNESSFKTLNAEVSSDTKETLNNFITTYDLKGGIDSLVDNVNTLNQMSNNELYQNQMFIDYIDGKVSQLDSFVQTKSDEFVDYTMEQKDLFVENVNFVIEEANGFVDYLIDTFDEAITTPIKDSYESYKNSDYFPTTNLIIG